MTDYFTCIIKRFIGSEPVVQPLFRSRFEQPYRHIQNYSASRDEYPKNSELYRTTKKNVNIEIEPENDSEIQLINPRARTNPVDKVHGIDLRAEQTAGSKSDAPSEAGLQNIKKKYTSHTISQDKLKIEIADSIIRRKQKKDHSNTTDFARSAGNNVDNDKKAVEVDPKPSLTLHSDDKSVSSIRILDFRPLIPPEKLPVFRTTQEKKHKYINDNIISRGIHDIHNSANRYRDNIDLPESGEIRNKKPSVSVTIGCVEIKSNVPPAIKSPAAKKSEPVLSLDQYLKNRNSE